LKKRTRLPVFVMDEAHKFNDLSVKHGFLRSLSSRCLTARWSSLQLRSCSLLALEVLQLHPIPRGPPAPPTACSGATIIGITTPLEKVQRISCCYSQWTPLTQRRILDFLYPWFHHTRSNEIERDVSSLCDTVCRSTGGFIGPRYVRANEL
jgi:hypothetical protein